ncbi:TIGR02678 family protein [Desulfoscipio gibsoniae]|uniref:TIGR02678 family protein n=1 Tax=Desulfoscipio gibsoniae DSM 7213 TaxID=767817 RepID=R4KD71_9FIRM|nr:TIGR02678 family protein [Desulfoscipio gibsoniae]AGL00509.1 TIGR02678 family protein [Desulfoscipio gibsoniae DSM 7213]
MARAARNNQVDKVNCFISLLNRPWVSKADDPELYQNIRSYYQELKDWFQEYCGFSLLLTRQIARLEKIPGRAHDWMGLELLNEPLDYALFTYCLWFLEGKSETDQFLLTEMIEEIKNHLTGSSMSLDFTLYQHRQSMYRALKQMRELKVLVAVDGDEMEWARTGSDRNVLYECSMLSRYVLRHFPRDLTTYDSLESLGELAYPDNQEGQLRRRRHRVYRRLLQEPVVHDWEWSQDERYYVLTQRHTILEHLATRFGLEGQRYREGLIFFYPDHSAETELFPTAKNISDIALLLAGEIRRLLHKQDTSIYTDEQGCVPLTLAELEVILLGLREKHKSLWSQQLRQVKSNELARELLEHLTGWGLATVNEQIILLHPALGRWNGHYLNNEDEE